MFNYISELKNAIDFPLREFFKWQRQGFRIQNEYKSDLFRELDAESQIIAGRSTDQYVSTYHLENIYHNSSRSNFRENLYYLEMLERALNLTGVIPGKDIYAADIGPSSWFYIQSYYALLKWWNCSEGRNLVIDGYEADAYRVYLDLYSRIDYASWYKKGLAGVNYIPEKFSAKPEAYDVVTMLFPFIFLPDHRQWGLPKNMFNPEEILQNAWQSLKPGGILIVANQGQAEHNEELNIFKNCGITPLADFCFESLFFNYDLSRYVLTGVKSG